MRSLTRRVGLRLAFACAVLSRSAGAAAQPVEPAPAPARAPSVERMLEGNLLTEDQKRDARLRFGAWTKGDLHDPAARARVALVTGDPAHDSLASPEADILDRAEGAAQRGDLDQALELLAGQSSTRAVRLRAEALERLGRFDDADAALEPLIARMASRSIDDADELAEGVRALMVRNRLRGPGRAGQAGADFEALMGLLGRAKNDLDRLSWYARLVEAEVLLDKDNPEDASAALAEVLALNPRCARAWRLLGDMAVASFDFDRAESIALRLDELAEQGPDASALRARAALRRRDSGLAAQLLDAALERYPRHRELLALQAATAAVRFDADRAAALLDAFDALNGADSPEALLAVGAALSEARQYADAADHLERAAARQPTLARPWIELGLLEMQSGRDVRARDALTKAIALDPFNVRARNSLALVEEIAAYAEIESEHFIVRYKPGIDAVLAAEMPAVLEAFYADITGPAMFDHKPATRTVIEVMPDHASFAVRITGMPQIHTMAAATGPVIAMETPRSGPGHRAGPYDWARTVRHEFIHTVTLSRTNNRIPHWFTEAAAVWGENGPIPTDWWVLLSRAYQADELFDMDTISLRFVRPLKPTDRTQAYAQGHWMYKYMVERYGVRAPLELMDLYAEGRSEREAMVAVLKTEPEQFFEDFKAWARAELVAVGMLLPEGVPTAPALLNGDPSEATLEDVQTALAEHPDHPDLLQLAVQLTLRATGGEPTPEIAGLLDRYARARPVDPLPRRLLAKLALAGAMDDAPDRAIEHLEFLDAHEMRSPAYALALAERYALAGRMDDAWAKARRATLIAPFDAPTREQAARIALLRGDLTGAERELVALTELEPDRDLHKRRLEALRAKTGG
jgi:tetratricopeptide (TPR) repeat protein